MGRKAMGNRPAILMGIREGKRMPDTYVITLPESGNHIFDIRPVMLLTKQERQGDSLVILGVASGHGEACEVVRDMVDDMYRLTGSFDWNGYMKSLDNRDEKVVTEETK